MALKQAMTPEFRVYQCQVVANCRALAKTLMGLGYKVVTGRTGQARRTVPVPSGVAGPRPLVCSRHPQQSHRCVAVAIPAGDPRSSRQFSERSPRLPEGLGTGRHTAGGWRGAEGGPWPRHPGASAPSRVFLVSTLVLSGCQQGCLAASLWWPANTCPLPFLGPRRPQPSAALRPPLPRFVPPLLFASSTSSTSSARKPQVDRDLHGHKQVSWVHRRCPALTRGSVGPVSLTSSGRCWSGERARIVDVGQLPLALGIWPAAPTAPIPELPGWSPQQVLSALSRRRGRRWQIPASCLALAQVLHALLQTSRWPCQLLVACGRLRLPKVPLPA